MAVKSKVPSDPTAWLQLREKYEAKILEDHDFSERHGIEYALWQLHYRRIENFRAEINESASDASSHGLKGVDRSAESRKIRLGFKAFLSEATGFYHDLILKIRAKYGLPLGYFSESTEMKDTKKSIETKKGLLSSHRCLVYLGDLARYKGMYGEGGDSASREYAAASSYYIQAASLWPSSGNPHHQLAILALYSGDELVAVYRYFRSLTADCPCITARDNLIIAFEKNRQNCSQLTADSKFSKGKPMAGRGRGRGAARHVPKETKKEEANPKKNQGFTIPEIYKTFCIQFVRVNGILFSRTSLETFGEIFAAVISKLSDLLSSGPVEELNFGSDAAECGLFVIRLIVILICTVHNVNWESEGLSYAEILQRSVLLQNAFIAAFEFVGHIIKRCIQLQDILSSYLLPAILVFLEWLACNPELASVTDTVEEKQAKARSFFWAQCIELLNKLVSSGCASVDEDEGETCFADMSRYEEEENDNQVVLWEDFELRGFSPLRPAHLILDFSVKHSLGSSGDNRQKRARVERILAAGRSLVHVAQVNQQFVYYDKKLKKFSIGTEPIILEDEILSTVSVSLPESNGFLGHGTTSVETTAALGAPYAPIVPAFTEEDEEDDEVIVFKPHAADRQGDVNVQKPIIENSSVALPENYGSAMLSAPLNNPMVQTTVPSSTGGQVPTSFTNVVQQPLPDLVGHTASNWFHEQSLFEGLKNLIFKGDAAIASKPAELQEVPKVALPSLQSPSINFGNNHNLPAQDIVVSEAMPMLPSNLDYAMFSGINIDVPAMMTKLQSGSTSLKRNPVSRPPSRHPGPPPGFSPVPPPRASTDSKAIFPFKAEAKPPVDSYSWVDGYQNIQSERAVANGYFNFHQTVTGNGISSSSGTMAFPFPGKQVPSMKENLVANHGIWQDNQLLEHLKLSKEQQFRHGNQESAAALPEYHQGQSLWSGRFLV